MADKVKVAVRLRPMNKREIDLGAKVVVDMEGNQTILCHPRSVPTQSSGSKESQPKHEPKSFAFDHCFWSVDETCTAKFVDQEVVFNHLGRDVLERAFEGYNACILAYGQTGSGKSYTMMGNNKEKGIIPRLCDALFERIVAREASDLSFKVEVSYMEIYNEKVHDLLDPNSKVNLKVREHNILGPYVDGLSQLAVKSFADIENLMVEGNKSRTVAATNMNSESSRSHAVFTIIVTQTLCDLHSGVSGERVSKMSLVDLAGSERVAKTGAIGERLKEGSNINKSLSTLGLVIKALAEQGGTKGKNNNKFVPYRDSVLTWLLKDNLGGNSKTVMVATVSPSADNYEETLSTLRYADSAKRIVNHAVINEDPNARIIRELREEVDHLRQQLLEAESLKAPDLKDRLEESEKLMKEISKTWEEKLQETERIHKERHAALESMGISVESSGIKVETGKSFLVNLNADPSLNELLVYYLKECTRVGRADASVLQDIQLSGLGIQPAHCIIEVPSPAEVYISPLEGACTCINGIIIKERMRARHGDRILWGNNHFFRLNCPRKEVKGVQQIEPEVKADYDFAQQELMMQEMSNDPIQEAISHIETQYENDKQAALEAQRQMYEEQVMSLRSQLASSSSSLMLASPSLSAMPWNRLAAASPSSGVSVQDRLQKRIQQMAQERNSNYKHSLTQLREDICRANAYVREANFFAKELSRDVIYQVTLQIPASNLSPNRHRGKFVSEPAILAREKYYANKQQLFTMDDFENRLLCMRELYQEYRDKGPLLVELPSRGDALNPFSVNGEWHDLIGVANVFLDALFYDVKLDYQVAVISQHGEVAGRLHVELWKVEGTLNDSSPDNASINSDDSDGTHASSSSAAKHIVVKVAIKDAKGLPPALSNFVFCQYSFWGQSDPIVVPPKVDEVDGNQSILSKGGISMGASIKFSNEQEFSARITEDFIDYLTDSALSIEVYGHRGGDEPATQMLSSATSIHSVPAPSSRSLADCWSEVTRKLQLWVEIHELNEQGEYQAVEVQPKPDVYCGGVFQIRQGHSRRLVARVVSVPESGSLPVICERISAVCVGGICARSQLQKGLDSYQEEGLSMLRTRWSEALDRRRTYLEEKMQALAQKDKSEAELERERNLMDQWQSLIKERDAVSVPEAGSGVPGAPADSPLLFGMEQHMPVVFLNLNAEDMSASQDSEELEPVMESCLLEKENNGSPFFPLPVVQRDDSEASVTALWDSTIHDSPHLNRVTPANERVYLIMKVYVRLSHPAPLDVTLRKRICINVYKKQSLTDKLKKKISVMGGGNSSAVGRLLHVPDCLTACGITYEVVSSIPKTSEELENRETLAKLAAESLEMNGGETYMEKYLKSVAAVDSIIALDRLGQEASIKESLLSLGRPARRFNSSPNISAANSFWSYYAEKVAHLLPDVKEYALSTKPHQEHSTTSLANKMMVRLSESFHDISKYVMKPSSAGAAASGSLTAAEAKRNADQHDSGEVQSGQTSGSKFALQSAQFTRPGNIVSSAAVAGGEQSLPPMAAGDLLRTPDASGGDSSSGYGSLTTSHSADGLVTYNSSSKIAAAAHAALQLAAASDDSADNAASLDTTEMPADQYHESEQCNPSEAAASGHSQTADPACRSIVSSHDEVGLDGAANDVEVIITTLPLDVDANKGLEAEEELMQSESNGDDCCSSAIDGKHELSRQFKILTSDSILVSAVTANETADEATEDEALIVAVGSAKQQPGGVEAAQGSASDGESVVSTLDEEDVGLHQASEDHLQLTKQRQQLQQTSTRLELLNDMYSVNALDELEALGEGGSLESLTSSDSCCGGSGSSPSPSCSTPTNGARPKDTGAKKTSLAIHPQQPRLASEIDSSDADTDDAVSQCSFGSHADLSLGSGSNELPPAWIQLGVSVIVLSTKGEEPKTGTVQFVGETSFALGTWIGIQLDSPAGKNDGTVRGVQYFSCEPKCGVFVRHDRLRINRKKALAMRLDVPTSSGGVAGVRHSWSGPESLVAGVGGTAPSVVAEGSGSSQQLTSRLSSVLSVSHDAKLGGGSASKGSLSPLEQANTPQSKKSPPDSTGTGLVARSQDARPVGSSLQVKVTSTGGPSFMKATAASSSKKK